jgi:hypothetical protein
MVLFMNFVKLYIIENLVKLYAVLNITLSIFKMIMMTKFICKSTTYNYLYVAIFIYLITLNEV